MRFVSNVLSARISPDTRQVRGLSATYGIKSVQPREHLVPYVEHHVASHQEPEVIESPTHRVQERRKACRRLLHQYVLIELRSGIDRRHHNVREGDVVEHIDETA